MKKKLIYIFIFNIILGTTLYAQKPKDSIAKSKDSIIQLKNKDSVVQLKDSLPKIKKKYGIRLGIDISQPIISLFEKEKNHTAVELVGDIRIKKNYYIATEMGYESRDSKEDFFAFSTKGNFFKIGVNRNFYENWGEMNNEVYIGIRYATAFFSHTLTSRTPRSSLNYFPSVPNNEKIAFQNLSAHWAEFVLGIKVETFSNLFIGLNAQFKALITSKQPDNFKNLYIPGFREVSDNNLGFGFTYTISYLIPIIKK